MLKGQGKGEAREFLLLSPAAKNYPPCLQLPLDTSVLVPASMHHHRPLSLHLKAKSGCLLLGISVLPSYPFSGSQFPSLITAIANVMN